jgi:hypothetical protein
MIFTRARHSPTLFVILGHSRVEVILLLEQTTLRTVALVWSELAQETNSIAATELILMVGDESFQRNGDPESSDVWKKVPNHDLFFSCWLRPVPELSIFSKPRTKGMATIP